MKNTVFSVLAFLLFLPGLVAGADKLNQIPLKNFNGGQSTQLEQYLGKPLVVNFWAPWCIPCKTEFPELEAFQRKYAGKAGLVAVTADVSEKNIKKFLSGMSITFPILTDPTSQLHEAVPVTGMPYTILLRADGTIENTFIGYTKEKKLTELESALNKLIN